MTARPVLARLHRVLVVSRPRQLAFSSRYFSDFGDSKPDAATDLSTSTKKESTKKTELDPSQFTVRIEVKMPAMGNGGGKVLKWYKSPGDVVHHEEVLCDIETKEFTFGMEVDDEQVAIVGDILVQAPSETVKDDEVLCILLHEESKAKAKPTKPE